MRDMSWDFDNFQRARLVHFGEVLPAVLDDFRPNLPANYVLELGRAYHWFSEACPVLKTEEPLRFSRLAFDKGLELLGIEVPERM